MPSLPPPKATGFKLSLVLLRPDSEAANCQILDTLKVPQILAGAYTDWSQMYRDAKTVWINQRSHLESTAPRAVMPAAVGTWVRSNPPGRRAAQDGA